MWFFNRNSRPGAEDVARRLVILKHIVASALIAPPRGVLRDLHASWEASEREGFERDANARREELWARLRNADLWRHLSPKERAYTGASMAGMTERQQVDASWRLESAQALMWALGMLPGLPGYDVMADPEVLKPVPSGDVREFIRTARLRSEGELGEERDRAEFWHWRSRTRELIERGEPFPDSPKMKAAGFSSYDDIVRLSARKAAEAGTIPSCVDDDFPARGKAYRDLTAEEWTEVRSITFERHFAFNWLCGRSARNKWDDTPTDT